MTKETIIKTDEYTLERIIFKIKSRPVYREIIKQNGELKVQESERLPQWFIRQTKLNYLLNEIQKN